MRFLGNKLLLFLIIFQLQFVYSNIGTRNFNSSNGLVNNSVRCFYEDDNDELWIGTDGGISIYDGYSFKNMTIKEGLVGNSIWAIVGDDFGGKWIASYNKGLTYIKEGKFINYDRHSGLSNTKIRTLYYQNKKLFIGTENGLFEFNYDNQTITEIPYLQDESQSFQVMQFFKQGEDLLVATRKTGVFKLEIKDYTSTSLNKIGQGETLFKVVPYLNNYFYCTGKGVYKDDKLLCGYNNKVHNNVIWDYAISPIRKDLYLASWNVVEEGGGLLKLVNDSLINYNTFFNIDSKKIWALKFLKNNQLVVGSLDNGVYIIDNQISKVVDDKMKNIQGTFTMNEKLFYYNDHQIFNNNGISVFSLSKENLIKWSNQKGLINSSFGDQTPLIEDFKGKQHQINTIKHFDSGIYVSTTIGLFKFSTSFQLEKIFLIQIDKFHITKSDLVYQRPYHEFNIIENFLTNDFRRTKVELNNTVPSEILRYQLLGDSLLIWTKSKAVFSYKKGKKLLQSKLDSRIGNIKLIDTWKNQVILVNSKDEVYKGVVTRTGIELFLLSVPIKINSIYKVSLNQNCLMIHYDNGIYLSDGLNERVINQNNILSKMTDYHPFLSIKELVIATSNSVVQVPIESVFTYQSYLPNIYIKNSTANIPYNQNSQVIEFKKVEIQMPYDFQYYYQLNGLDTVPISADKIYLLNLSSGEYNLKLLGYSTFKNEWFTSSSYSFKKLKAPWEKMYFWILGVVFIVGITIVIYYRRKIALNKRVFEQQSLEKKLISHRLEAIQAKMNPHFMFNALNSIQNYIIDTDTDKALLYLSEFSRLMRETLEYSSMGNISLSEEIKFLERYIRIEQMRLTSTIKLEKNIVGALHSIQIPPMILQPLIENAFIHGLENNSESTQTICLSIIKVDDSQTKITVSNTKSNHKQSFETHKSFGLSSIEERLKLMDSRNTIRVIDSNTDFIVEIELYV